MGKVRRPRRSNFGGFAAGPRVQLAFVAVLALAGLLAAWKAWGTPTDNSLQVLYMVLAVTGLGGAAVLAHFAREKQGSIVEGGIEWRGALGAGHVPFSELRDATLEDAQKGTLRLDTTTGARVRVRLAGGAHADDLERVLKGIHSAHHGADDIAHLARGGATLDEWTARVRTLVGKGGDYRAASFDAARLWSVLRDPARAEDVRAACAYALLSIDRAQWAPRVRALVGVDAPPILIVMTRLAPGGTELVDGATFASAVALLDERDRDALADEDTDDEAKRATR